MKNVNEIYIAKSFRQLVLMTREAGHEKSSGYLKRKNGVWIFEVKDEKRR